MELINTLGIDWRILLWQIVMFFVLLGILRKFAYGPVMKALDERKARIEQGLADAADASRARAEADVERSGIVAAAHKDAAQIVAEARTVADAQREAAAVRTRSEVERLLKDGQARLARERAAMLESAEGELAGILRAGLEKVLGRAVTDKDHERLMADALKTMKNARA